MASTTSPLRLATAALDVEIVVPVYNEQAALERFLGIGVLSTLAFALLFLLLHGPLGAAGANATALALTAVGNTAANRRFTFGVRGRADLLRHHWRGAGVFVLTLALSSGALSVLQGIDTTPPRAVELAVLWPSVRSPR